MKVTLIFIISLFASYLVGQSGSTNPFDLSHRLDSIYVAPANSPVASENVFDINRGDNTDITTPELQSGEQETITVQSTEIEQRSELRPDPIEKIYTDNPFEVSHIPIRRSKLKEEANAFKSSNASNDTSTSNIFIFWLILLSGVIVAFVINTKKSVIPSLVKALTNTNVLMYNKREENSGLSGHYLLLYIIFFINAAIFLYLILDKYALTTYDIGYLYCFLAVLLLYTCRHLLLTFFSYMFPVEKDMGVYNFSIHVNNNLLGLVLIPLNLIVAFGPTSLSLAFVYISVFVVGSFYLIRTIRGLLLAAPYIQKHIFHFFLYLCAFEIMPILLCIKLMV